MASVVSESSSTPAVGAPKSSAATVSSTYNPPNQMFRGDISRNAPTINGAPKGRNVSGRSWKLRPQKRASSLVTKVATNNRSKSWQRKAEEREARRLALEREREMKEERRKAIVEKRDRRLENERRRAENEFKNAQRSAMVLGKNADIKMRAMSKKQLRQIKKTRMNTKTGVIEYVPAYAK
eukprot:CAMPEP_0183307376 /NCGR_PEP_ID=MMETSP0160_2-20130417/17296_1 /TAXON_ID=2839 ORGANISM="Odontella Sinensis, Strain Grunow 1884" /NCGR_SAMPLE_ID=MMETSP0160_2 /ASSEMBLY_ACC=CAM_ASM_000250 /LENGTH=180 /DNA_ID=CAMNT_0025470951 /DNA_START=55 /DNA_END=597 /DNA_ORIENTATION=-